MMNLMNRLAKSLMVVSFAFASMPAHAQTSAYDNYDNKNVEALTNCQKNKNCTAAQKAELNTYTNEGKTLCGGQTCTSAQLNAMANTQAETYSNQNDPNYQSGINAANGTGTVVQPTYSTNTATGGAGTASSSGSKGQMIMVASAGAAVATATVLKKPCMSVTGSAWACPLMAMAIGQVAMSLGGAKGAGESSSALASDGYTYGSGRSRVSRCPLTAKWLHCRTEKK
ncbi:MAG: hypothetical protein EOP05_23830 [Proteobacteria bacterium]|nr:MAG: hypothetical protein EOP05_23830 [Pseudomonadota bacterium]